MTFVDDKNRIFTMGNKRNGKTGAHNQNRWDTTGTKKSQYFRLPESTQSETKEEEPLDPLGLQSK